MKLKDVATVIHGVKILPEHLQTETEPGALAVVTDENIKNGLVEKESVRFMKSNVYRRFYTQSDVRAKEGDYLYSDKTQQLIPFSSLGTETMPGDDFLIVRAGGAYLGTFLGHPNGPQYLIQELHKITISEAPDRTERIGDIYLPSDFAELDEMFYVRPDKRRDIDLSKINIKQGLMTLDFIIKQITQNVIDMNSNDYFQRKDGLWDDGKKSRFIEALIVKQPVPAFYFDCSDQDHWLVVDGLQRLGTVREFIIEKKLPLTDLYYLPAEYEGKNFDQLPTRAQRNIEGYQVMAYTIEAPTPKEVKYKIFKSINESPLVLSEQEIRHALNHRRDDGDKNSPAEYILGLSKTRVFADMCVEKGVKTDRMEDRELALRHIAFRITPYLDYKPKMNDFLDEAMTALYRIEDKDKKRYQEDFGEAIFALTSIFEDAVFTKTMIGAEGNILINSLFEAWTRAFAIIKQDARDRLLVNKESVLKAAKNLHKDSKYMTAIDASKAYTIENLRYRFKTTEQLILSLLK